MDYDIWYNGQVIGNTTSLQDKQALRNARLQYGQYVTVSKTRGTQVAADAAKAESIRLYAKKVEFTE